MQRLLLSLAIYYRCFTAKVFRITKYNHGFICCIEERLLRRTALLEVQIRALHNVVLRLDCAWVPTEFAVTHKIHERFVLHDLVARNNPPILQIDHVAVGVATLKLVMVAALGAPFVVIALVLEKIVRKEVAGLHIFSVNLQHLFRRDPSWR